MLQGAAICTPLDEWYEVGGLDGLNTKGLVDREITQSFYLWVLKISAEITSETLVISALVGVQNSFALLPRNSVTSNS
ncbi:MAG: hypothetical protein U5L01_10780 [Rheinheimera sp.]|nr:hypothetical protein [Rheinheimera sp.]